MIGEALRIKDDGMNWQNLAEQYPASSYVQLKSISGHAVESQWHLLKDRTSNFFIKCYKAGWKILIPDSPIVQKEKPKKKETIIKEIDYKKEESVTSDPFTSWLSKFKSTTEIYGRRDITRDYRRERVTPIRRRIIKHHESVDWDPDDTLTTESLGKILMEQGQYKMAIDIYQRLRQKYPEKDDIFARQIENLKQKAEEE